jgi:hypothetical protein
MKEFLQEHGYDIWYLVVPGYNVSKKPKNASKKELKKKKNSNGFHHGRIT